MIQKLCTEIYELFINQPNTHRCELTKKAHKLSLYCYHKPINASALKAIFELEYKLVTTKGANKSYVEKKIFDGLFSICDPMLDSGTGSNLTNIKKSDANKMALLLVEFLKTVFEYKVPRDSFNNQRKALAFELLKYLADIVEIPEVYELCLTALKTKKKTLVLAAIDYMAHYTSAKDIELSQEVIDILDKLAIQAKDRSIVFGALDIQIESGIISEFEAMARMDDWKDKNYG